MSPIKILHMADLHPISDGTIAGKAAMKNGFRQSFIDFCDSLNFIKQIVIDEQIDYVVMAGDIFNTEKPTIDELVSVIGFLNDLPSTVEVIIIPGNHDKEPSGVKISPVALMGLTCKPNIHVYMQPFIHVDHARDISFYCLPFPAKGFLMANQLEEINTPEKVNAAINIELRKLLQHFSVQRETSFRVFVGHGSLQNVRLGEQPRSLAHDILIPQDLLEQSGYDYCALGHIHQRQQVGESQIWYSGSLLCQSFGEETEEKGVNVVTLQYESKAKVSFKRNPHSRVYQTITPEKIREFLEAPRNLDTAYRIKGTLSEEEYANLKPSIEQCFLHVPFMQLSIDIQRHDRARDKAMNTLSSPAESVVRYLNQQTITEDTKSKALAMHEAFAMEGKQ